MSATQTSAPQIPHAPQTQLAPHTPLAPHTAELELQLLIKEARRRQRRRRLATVLLLAVGIGAYLGIGAATAPRGESLLSRPLHLPALGRGGSCPVSSGSKVSTPSFAGVALGKGPVRVLVENRGEIDRGRPQLGIAGASRWRALQTIWFAAPRYRGPFVVRAARIGARGPIEVRPGESGLRPGSGPLVVPAVADAERRLAPGGGDYRTVPGSTWVTSPGCYGWQIDGRGFSEVIVFDALAPPR